MVNATNQFSDINGPISRRHGRRSVAQLPASTVSRRVDELVDSYLAERAASVGSHLNYVNPNYSDAKNLAWINALDGPRLGRGTAIHHHGTVPELQRHRPGAFRVQLPQDAHPAASAPAPAAGRRIDGNAVAAANGVAVKSAGVRLGQLDPSMEPVIRSVAAVAREQGLPGVVITSGNDSRHSRNSLHYADRALDFRGNNITVAQGRLFRDAVRAGWEAITMSSSRSFLTRPTTTCTSNTIRTEGTPRFRARSAVLGAAMAWSLALAGCSEAATAPETNTADTVVPAAVVTLVPVATEQRTTGVPAPAPKSSPDQTASRVISTTDRTLSDGKVCDVAFVYAGREPENIFWEEPCAEVTAKMMGRAELERLGRWERLDSFERKFVEAMPGGKVLYVGGGASASIYPIGTGGTAYEVAVAD